MNIYGKEYGFMLTVGASADIADLCPEGDIERLGEALEGAFSKTLDVTVGMMVAMSKGYEMNKAYEEPGYIPDPLTKDILKSLPQKVFAEVEAEAVKAFSTSKERTVEVEEPKAKKN